jgi:hypothetical protein
LVDAMPGRTFTSVGQRELKGFATSVELFAIG